MNILIIIGSFFSFIGIGIFLGKAAAGGFSGVSQWYDYLITIGSFFIIAGLILNKNSKSNSNKK
jgi:hypothetical protein